MNPSNVAECPSHIVGKRNFLSLLDIEERQAFTAIMRRVVFDASWHYHEPNNAVSQIVCRVVVVLQPKLDMVVQVEPPSRRVVASQWETIRIHSEVL
eukprot:1122048-Amphidinium_carterae.1